MSIWEKLGFGGYKGFSHESDQLLRSAVELAGNLAAKKPIPATCCWRSCSRITGRQHGFWRASRSGNRRCAVSWPRAAAHRLCIWIATLLRRTSSAPWITPSSGTERAPEPGRAGTSALRHAGR